MKIINKLLSLLRRFFGNNQRPVAKIVKAGIEEEICFTSMITGNHPILGISISFIDEREKNSITYDYFPGPEILIKHKITNEKVKQMKEEAMENTEAITSAVHQFFREMSNPKKEEDQKMFG